MRTQVEQFPDVVKIVGDGRVVPAVGRVPCQANGKQYVAHRRAHGVPPIADTHEQFRQAPRSHERQLQIGQRDVEHRALCMGGSQRRPQALLFRDAQRQAGGMAPQQHFRQVVQQGSLLDHGRVVVHPVDRECEREPRSAGCAQHHGLQTLERAGMRGQA